MGILGPHLAPTLRSRAAATRGGFPFLGVMANPPAITVTNGSATTIAGGVQAIKTDPGFRYTAPPMAQWTTNTGYLVVGDGTANDISSFVAVEFLSSAPQVEFKLLRFNTVANIRVDGELVQDASFSFDAAGSGVFVKLDWSASANPTKLRRYRLTGFNMPFGGVFTPTGADGISYPTSLDSVPLMAFLGDSYTQGTGANGPDRVYANALATALGYAYWGDGLGGSGWNTASTNDPTSRIGRRIAKLTKAPAVIVTALGYNDAGSSMATLATSYDAAIAALKAAYPAAKIVSLGPWTPLGSTANLATVAATVSGRAAAAGVPFVDIADVINANNKATFIGGDNVHPVQAGHEFLGRSIAPRMRPSL